MEGWKMSEKDQRFLLSKSVGETKIGQEGFGRTHWNNAHSGTDGPILCEICGTEHPERQDEGYVWSYFLGFQVVEECCGAILDRVFKESGEEFAIAFLHQFAADPTNSRFWVFAQVLKRTLAEALKKLDETRESVQAAAEMAEKINS
jgi:hypothetical protein